MMKNLYKYKYRKGGKLELLSAYLDNELSDEEIKKLEEELQFSRELQDELAELKKVKLLTVASVKPVEENPYFETRLAASLKIKNPWYHNLKRFSPVYGVVALSLALMVLLKFNPQIIDKILDQQKTNLTAFYKENLKPLLYTANLTNEDIFDFAFYHQLPLDAQKKQYLMLGSDNSGKPYFEIKDQAAVPNGSNLERFVKNLNLNDKQQKQVDSILASYAGDLQAQVLVNEKNTVAINPNIWNFNKALAMDLISFAQKVNKNELQKVLPPDYNRLASSRDMHQIAKQIKSAKNNNYIFFTSDSIFADNYHFDEAAFNKEMEKWSAEMGRNFSRINDQFKDINVNVHFGNNFSKLKKGAERNKSFNVYVDSNLCRVDIPDVVIPPVVLPDMGRLGEEIDSITKYFGNFAFVAPNNGKNKNYNYKYFYSDSSKGYNFNFRAFGFDSTFPGSPKAGLSKKRNKSYGFNPDSLASIFRMFMGDSAGAPNQKDIQKQLKMFQKQMQQFQKQMEQMQKEFNKNSPEEPPRKPVEI